MNKYPAQRPTSGPMSGPMSELTQVFQDVPNGFCTFDIDFRYVFVNEWLAALNGVSAAEHIGRTIHEVIPDVAAGVEAQLRQVIETGEPIVGGEVEAETPANPGEKRVFRHTYTAIKDNDAEIVGLSCLVSDVTKQHRAESAMRENVVALDKSQERLNLSLEAASIGTWSWNLLDGTHFWDSRMLAMAGMPLEALTGIMANDFIRSLHPDDESMVMEAIRRSLEEGAEYNVDYRLIRRDNGEVRNINARALVIHDDAGKPIRMTGVALDVTEQKKAKAEIQSQRDELEVLNRQKDQLFSIIGHDLKDPFNSILGFSELMLAEGERLSRDQLIDVARSINDGANLL